MLISFTDCGLRIQVAGGVFCITIINRKKYGGYYVNKSTNESK